MTRIQEVRIGPDAVVGDGHPCWIIAEAGVNHDGDPAKAMALIDIAAEAGVDAVKLQTFTAESLASRDAVLATYHRKGAVAENETLKELLKRLELSREDHLSLFRHARDLGLTIFSTPFDVDSVDFLEDLGVALFKIASFSLTNYPLLRHVALKKRPIIMSTGLHTLGEIERAVQTIQETGNRDLILLQCTSHYPCSAGDAHLGVMQTLKTAFGVPVGYSDHTMGIAVSLGAAALGASVIEKHFTFDTTAFGVDHEASIGPGELRDLVRGVRDIEEAMGSTVKTIPEIEKEIQRVHRPSLVSRTDIHAGTVIEEGMIAIKKPGTGIHPADLPWVVGRRAKRGIQADRLIRKEDLE